MHYSASGQCKPTVHVGLNHRIHVIFAPNGPSVVGTRKEMLQLADSIRGACSRPELFIEGDIQFGNADLAEQTT